MSAPHLSTEMKRGMSIRWELKEHVHSSWKSNTNQLLATSKKLTLHPKHPANDYIHHGSMKQTKETINVSSWVKWQVRGGGGVGVSWIRSWMQEHSGTDHMRKVNGSVLTCRTLLVRPVFWASCLRSLASGLWLMAK